MRMSCVCKGYGESAVTLYLLNHNLQEAYEVGDLSFLKPEDLDPELEDKYLGIYPPIVNNRFVNGVALFEWNTMEDGEALIDGEGFGERSSEPWFMYGVVDQRLEVIGKFQTHS